MQLNVNVVGGGEGELAGKWRPLTLSLSPRQTAGRGDQERGPTHGGPLIRSEGERAS